MWQRSTISENSPVERLLDPLFERKQLEVFVKREDLIHPEISGNKWRKLKYNLIAAQQQGCKTLLTFGGAFSNHIAATAFAAREFGLNSIGVIRGEECYANNPTLSRAKEWGMHLKFVDRKSYKLKTSPEFMQHLEAERGRFYLIPEGGDNGLGVKGCEEILDGAGSMDFVVVAVGTGTTLKGIAKSTLNKEVKIIGVPVLKGLDLSDMTSTFDNLEIQERYHFGGYAKWQPQLIDFINAFKATHQIALDPIYTGKVFYALMDLIRKDYFPKGSKIIVIHTGGLQGIRGFNERFGNIIL